MGKQKGQPRIDPKGAGWPAGHHKDGTPKGPAGKGRGNNPPRSGKTPPPPPKKK